MTTVREATFELFREHDMTTIFGNPGSTELLSPLYNHRDDSWGGDPKRRLRFPFECMRGIRAAVGHEPFVGYRINSTSFWPGDLETADIVDTRWPMIGMERILDVYFEWIYPRLYAADVEMITDMWATGIEGRNVTLSLVHDHYRQTTRTLGADSVVMVNRTTLEHGVGAGGLPPAECRSR